MSIVVPNGLLSYPSFHEKDERVLCHEHTDDIFTFYSPPKQRHRWGETQELPHVNWGDLFFDLFYVGAAYLLAAILKEEPGLIGVLYFLGCFFPIYSLWLDKTFYDARYAIGDDFVHHMYQTLYNVILASCIFAIRPVEFLSHPKGFPYMMMMSVCFAMGSFMTILRAADVYFFGDCEDAARRSSKIGILLKLFPFSLHITAAIIAGLEYALHEEYHKEGYRLLAGDTPSGTENEGEEPNHIPVILNLAAFFSMLIPSFIQQLTDGKTVIDQQNGIPMNVIFAIHRYGEWTMLMLGETVLSLLLVAAPEDGAFGFFGVFYIGLLSAIYLMYLNFKYQPHDPSHHALKRGRKSAAIFTLVMPIYSAALVGLGASFKMMMYWESNYATYLDEKEAYESKDAAHRLLSDIMDMGILPAGNTLDDVRNILQSDMDRGLAGDYPSDKEIPDKLPIMRVYCGCLTLVFITLDIMLLSHNSLNSILLRLHTRKSHQITLVSTFNIGLTIFSAVMYKIIDNFEILVGIGLLTIILNVASRIYGEKTIHHVENYDESHEKESDVEQEKENDEK